MVVQLTRNEQVTGSSPVVGSAINVFLCIEKGVLLVPSRVDFLCLVVGTAHVRQDGAFLCSDLHPSEPVALGGTRRVDCWTLWTIAGVLAPLRTRSDRSMRERPLAIAPVAQLVRGYDLLRGTRSSDCVGNTLTRSGGVTRRVRSGASDRRSAQRGPSCDVRVGAPALPPGIIRPAEA